MESPESEPAHQQRGSGKREIKGAREGGFRSINSISLYFSPSPSFSPRKMRDICVKRSNANVNLLKGGGVQKGGRGGKRGGGKIGRTEKESPTERPEGRAGKNNFGLKLSQGAFARQGVTAARPGEK